jgi:hypothetical protein
MMTSILLQARSSAAQALEAGEVPLVEGDFARPVELDDVAGGDLVEESLTPSDEGLPALARG